MLTAASLILLILATVLSLGGQPAVQAQDNQGAIGNLSVSSPDPGQVPKRGKTLVRDQPNSTPQQQGKEEDSNQMMERSQILLDGPYGQPGLFPQGRNQA